MRTGGDPPGRATALLFLRGMRASPPAQVRRLPSPPSLLRGQCPAFRFATGSRCRHMRKHGRPCPAVAVLGAWRPLGGLVGVPVGPLPSGASWRLLGASWKPLAGNVGQSEQGAIGRRDQTCRIWGLGGSVRRFTSASGHTCRWRFWTRSGQNTTACRLQTGKRYNRRRPRGIGAGRP